MNQELFDKFVSLTRGTFLEEDRNSNFPSENTVPKTHKDLCEEDNSTVGMSLKETVCRLNSDEIS